MELRSLKKSLAPLLLVLLGVPATALGQSQPPPAAEKAPPVETLAAPVAETPPPVFPGIDRPELINVPGDDGTRIGLLWYWSGEPSPECSAVVQVLGDPAWLEEFRLSAEERKLLDDTADWLAGPLGELLPLYDAA
jgi:hypothetical protein